MSEDTIYNSASLYMTSVATIAMKGALAGIAINGGDNKDRIPQLAFIATASSLALEQNGIIESKTLKDDTSEEWRFFIKSLERMVERRDLQGIDAVEHVVGDVLIQKHSNDIILALDDPEKEKQLSRSDKYVLDSVREGGDTEQLVRLRASGKYEELTPDQQGDIAEDIFNKKMIGPNLDIEIQRSVRALELVERSGDRIMTQAYPEISRENTMRADNLVEHRQKPETDADRAVMIHAQAFPSREESNTMARSAILGGVHDHGKDPYKIALEIQAIKIAIDQAQQNVANGNSNNMDRKIAFGRGYEPQEVESIQYPDMDVMTKAKLAYTAERVKAVEAIDNAIRRDITRSNQMG